MPSELCTDEEFIRRASVDITGTLPTPAQMKASFVRTEGAPDRIYVVRSDGSETSWSFPTYGDGLPHDLCHLVVEDESYAFSCRRKFAPQASQ